MNNKEQFLDIKFAEDIENYISQINEEFTQLINFLFDLKVTINNEEFLQNFSKFKENIKSDFSNGLNYTKVKKSCFEDANNKFKNYSETISKIYKNDYIKSIIEHKQEIENLIYNFNSESDHQNLNSFSSDNNKSTNKESDEDKDEERNSENIIDGFQTFIIDNNNNNNDDISKNTEINFNCSVCPIENPKKAIIFCEKCNQLFCDSCYEAIKKYDINQCKHNIQNIAKMEERNKKGKKSFLNSLNIFFKRIILKSNYLLNNQNQKIKFINNGDANSSKINFIKKNLFEYPIIKDINDLTEINFLKCINDILINNLEINNIDINSYNIYEMNEDLVIILKNIFMDEKSEKINLDLGIKDLVREEEDKDDFNGSDEEIDIIDEKNIIKPKK